MPEVTTPTSGETVDWILGLITENPTAVAVAIVAAFVLVAVRALGGAVAGAAGKLSLPIGAVVLLALAIGASVLFR